MFEKYKTRLRAPQATVEKQCVAVVKEVSGFELALDQVEYTVSTRTIALKVPSVLKSELRFYTPQIMQELENRLGKDGCPKVVL